jgi:cold shock CspA family protein
MSSTCGKPSPLLPFESYWLCLLFIVPLLLSDGASAGAVVNPPSTHVVTGTLAMIDLNTGKGMIKTDLGKPIFFQISRPDQFSHLSIGNVVTIQLDEEGRAVKVIEAVPSELPPPSTGP